ncbi:putative tyrosinase [Amylocarpus encephaloides]|uniref:Tyrosinase n=1 Tax=Amylocarpus encephaloides TaxID=45428 RepID=A0A9P8C1U8_9HELO|nr:putative tyrosinase [Amylocarpus encephaloides]
MSKPSITDPALVPGAKSRYDDFLYTHINQTLSIHGTGNFLFWHRYFTWTYENALREECGYTGYQPYWNWGKWAADPLSSPIFDGGEYSMSGNGEYAPHGCTQALPTGLNCVPDDGTGGGCVTTGPFKDMTVNLGPVSPTLSLTTANSTVTANDGTVYNPRCLRRAVSSWVSTRYTSDKNVTDLITDKNNIADFQTTMQGNFATGEYGVHTGGHFTIGGDPGGDIFTSPGDPTFYLHHAQIDRAWWIWQNQDPAGRRNVVGDTITLNNNPASRDATLDDLVNLGVNAPDITLRNLASTTAGTFCYIYI